MTTKTETSDPPYPWLKVIAMSALMFGGLMLMIYHSCTSQSEIRGDARAYLEALREDRLDDAYELLATPTKRTVSREAFGQSMYTPRLRQASSASFYYGSVSSAGHGCLHSGITLGDEGQSFYLYMVREGESWRVHSITFESVLTDGPWIHCR